MTVLTKIISGGQTGVDFAAIETAWNAGFETGGWAPRGWRTQAGPLPVLAQYGLREHESPEYPPRTEANVRDSDATLQIARDFTSPGERLTTSLVERYRRPHLSVTVDSDLSPTSEGLLDSVEKWIRENRISVLNVAGNSEKTAPGIGEWTSTFLRRLLSRFVVLVSASQVTSFDRCKRLWWYKSVLGLSEGPSSPAQVFGTVLHGAIERWLGGQEPHPSGWEGGLHPVDADLARRLLADATTVRRRGNPEREDSVIRRVPGQHVEARFVLPLVPAEGPLPEVRILGYADLVHPTADLDGGVPYVADHKTMRNLNYALTRDEIRRDRQLLVYAKALLEHRRSDGLADPAWITVRHNRYQKERVEADWIEALVSPEEIEEHWREKLAPVAVDMRAIRARFTPTEGDDVQAHAFLAQVPAAEVDRTRVLTSRNGPCGKYNGCAFREVCGGVHSLADHRRIVGAESPDSSLTSPRPDVNISPVASTASISTPPTSIRLDSSAPQIAPSSMNGNATVTNPSSPHPSTSTAQGEVSLMTSSSIFGQRGPATAAPSAPPVASAPQAPPAAPPPTPPAAPSMAPGRLHPQAPPWTRTDCGACRSGEGGTNVGFSTVGDPCHICSGRQHAENKITGYHFATFYSAAEKRITWNAKPEVAAQIQAAGIPVSGAIEASWVRAPGTPPQAAPVASVPQAAPPPPPQAAPAPFAAPQAPASFVTGAATPGLFGSMAAGVPGVSAPTPQSSSAPFAAATQFPGHPASVSFSGAPQGSQAAPTPPPTAPAPFTPPTQQAASQAPSAPVAPPTPPPTPAPAAAPNGNAAPAAEGKSRAKKGFTLLVNCYVAGPANNQVRLETVFLDWSAKLAGDPEARRKCGATPEARTYGDLNVWKRREVLAEAVEGIIEQEKFGTKRVLADVSSASPDFRAFVDAVRMHADEVIVGAGVPS